MKLYSAEMKEKRDQTLGDEPVGSELVILT